MTKKPNPKSRHKAWLRQVGRSAADLSKRGSALPWKKVLLIIAGGVLLLMLATQLFYPANRTLAGARIDDIGVGGMTKDEAAQKLLQRYQKRQLAVYFGEAEEPYQQPALETLGVSVNADEAVKSASYPWWLRLVPTSLWWGHKVVKAESPKVALSADKVAEYSKKELGESCQIDPVNAGIKVKDNQLTLVPSVDGGHCELSDVTQSISGSKLAGVAKPSVRIELDPIKPDVVDDTAQKLVDTLETQLAEKITLQYGDKTFELQPNTVRKWLKFSVNKDQIQPSIDSKKATEPLHELLDPAVARAPGVMTVKTRDFQVISQSGGGNGQRLDVGQTTAALLSFLQGESDDVPVATATIPPTKKYIRTYSSTDTGLSALMKNYAADHKGVYAASLIELSGQRRRAEYQGTKNFFPASTYKVFIAYSTLKRIESGKLKWNTQVTGGRDVATCFDDMLVLSDNPCPEKLTTMIGVTALNKDLAEAGLNNTRLVGPMKHQTTANDLSIFMAALESGQLDINSANRTKFINALKRNVFRKGIPTGAKGAVANKVGFINSLLHDTAIVYSPSGTYVLTVLTDNSSWDNIAQLTRELEALRAK